MFLAHFYRTLKNTPLPSMGSYPDVGHILSHPGGAGQTICLSGKYVRPREAFVSQVVLAIAIQAYCSHRSGSDMLPRPSGDTSVKGGSESIA